jgi:hypothetical protein
MLIASSSLIILFSIVGVVLSVRALSRAKQEEA